MNFLLLLSVSLFIYSCSSMPEITKALDDMETDNAITCSITKEAIQKETDVTVRIDVKNKDKPKPIPIQASK